MSISKYSFFRIPRVGHNGLNHVKFFSDKSYKLALKVSFKINAHQRIKNDWLTHKRKPRGRLRVEIVLIMYIKLLLMLFSFNLSGCACYTQCVTKIRHNACHYVFLVSWDEMSTVHDTRQEKRCIWLITALSASNIVDGNESKKIVQRIKKPSGQWRIELTYKIINVVG
jgi:hypothetical protein